MLSMCSLSWEIFIGGIRTTALMLLISTVYLIHTESLFVDYNSYMMAHTFFEMGQAVLIVTVLVSAIIEDQN